MVTCQTVIVKFMNQNNPRQEIAVTHISGGHRLRVSEGDQFIAVDCLTEQGVMVKQINFNISDVKEYSCEGVTPPSFFVPTGGAIVASSGNLVSSSDVILRNR